MSKSLIVRLKRQNDGTQSSDEQIALLKNKCAVKFGWLFYDNVYQSKIILDVKHEGSDILISTDNYPKLENEDDFNALRDKLIKCLQEDNDLQDYYIAKINSHGLSHLQVVNFNDIPVKAIVYQSHSDIDIIKFLSKRLKDFSELGFKTYCGERPHGAVLSYRLHTLNQLVAQLPHIKDIKKTDPRYYRIRLAEYELSILKNLKKNNISLEFADSRALWSRAYPSSEFKLIDNNLIWTSHYEHRNIMLSLSYLRRPTSTFGNIGADHAYGMIPFINQFPEFSNEFIFLHLHTDEFSLNNVNSNPAIPDRGTVSVKVEEDTRIAWDTIKKIVQERRQKLWGLGSKNQRVSRNYFEEELKRHRDKEKETFTDTLTYIYQGAVPHRYYVGTTLTIPSRQSKLDHLVMCIKLNDIDEIKQALQQGVDIDTYATNGDTPLITAVETNCSVEIIEYLLRFCPILYLNKKIYGDNEASAIYFAIMNKRADIIKKFLEYDPAVNFLFCYKEKETAIRFTPSRLVLFELEKNSHTQQDREKLLNILHVLIDHGALLGYRRDRQHILPSFENKVALSFDKENFPNNTNLILTKEDFFERIPPEDFPKWSIITQLMVGLLVRNDVKDSKKINLLKEVALVLRKKVIENNTMIFEPSAQQPPVAPGTAAAISKSRGYGSGVDTSNSPDPLEIVAKGSKRTF